jgi:hypothetical protein
MAHPVSSGQLQCNILSNSRCSPIRPRLVSLFLAELRPFLSLCDSNVHDGFLQASFDSAGDLKIDARLLAANTSEKMRTLTFFPSSFKVYSMVVLIPFSSTNSSFFGNSMACRSDAIIRAAIRQLKHTKVVDVVCP